MAAADHRPFAMVLAGGGARGFAHVGVLRTMEDMGLRPSALVGVSMGAIVSTTYATRTDWYEALMGMDTSGFPQPSHADDNAQGRPTLTRAVQYVHTAWNMITGWGAPASAVDAGHAVLRTLLGEARLEDGRVSVAVCATDLTTGRRVTLREGKATDAVYASAALAGVLPPLPLDGHLLADGAYSDIAPIDVARAFGHSAVIVVDPGQPSGVAQVGNGLQSLMRAMEICHLRHAELRVQAADLVIRPFFPRPIDILDFSARDECARAGVEAVGRQRSDILQVLRLEDGGPA